MQNDSSARSLVRRGCPLCTSREAHQVLDLPPTPLGDRFLRNRIKALELPLYPLNVLRCTTCQHIYLPFVTSPEESYSEYLFTSAISPGLVAAFSEIAADMCQRHRIGKGDLVLDIGANDGSWLSCFESSSSRVLAVEPAPGPAALASERGIPVISEYFRKDAIFQSKLLTQPPRIVSLNYVFANVPNPLDVLSDVAAICDENSIISILTGYHPAQLSVSMFDYIYHEHLSYFTLLDFQLIAEQLGLVVTFCRELPLKGGSIHIELKKKTPGQEQSAMFSMLLKREGWLDQPKDTKWLTVQQNLKGTKDKIRQFVDSKKCEQAVILGYGASHSTTTLSYTLGIEDDMHGVIDDNPSKQDTYAPGSGVRVGSLGNLCSTDNVVSIIVLAWQHGPAIIERLRQIGFRGSVAVPFPTFQIQTLM